MAAGRARELLEAFSFRVDIGGLSLASSFFSKFGPLELDLSQLSYRQGGAVTPIKDPDEVSFKPVTLERGASRDRAFYDWVMEAVSASLGPQPVGRDTTFGVQRFKRDITVFQLDRQRGTSIRKHRLFGAWPVAFTAGDWDNARDEVIIERLTLAYDWFELAQGGDRFPSAVELVPI